MIEELVFWDQQTKKAFEEMCNDPKYTSTREPVLKDLLYYAPSDDIFNEVKSQAIAIVNESDNVEAYKREKLDFLENITNVKDNALAIIGRFSLDNVYLLSKKISQNGIKSIMVRLTAANAPEEYRIIFSNDFDRIGYGLSTEIKGCFEKKPITPSV